MNKDLEDAIKTLSIYGAEEILFNKDILEKMDNIDTIILHNPLSGNLFGVILSTGDTVYFRKQVEQELKKKE